MTSRRDLVHLVMRRGVLLTSANDPWVLAAVAGLLLGTSVLACVWPARRATRADISRLLRSE